MKPGQWLLLSGSDITDQMIATNEPHKTRSLILMLRVESVAADSQAPTTMRNTVTHDDLSTNAD